MSNAMNAADKREYKEWLDLCDSIRRQTISKIPFETEMQKQKRIAYLQSDFFAFAKYYFARYMRQEDGKLTEFGWFHRKAVKTILPNTITVLEWAREHAKSVFADIMLPMFDYARGKMTGMVIASANKDKAEALLGDIQAEFENNELWLHDYGNLTLSGNWTNGQFTTTQGIGFWAFGIGQSPRGIRAQEKRPNYCVIDDADTKERNKNPDRVREAVNWIKEDLFGAIGLTNDAKFIIAGNRTGKHSIVSYIVGDVEPNDPIDPNINHIKVFALENPKTHKKDENGTPAWKERYTKQHFELRRKLIGTNAFLREYFHQHIEEGTVFRNEWIQWRKPLPLHQYAQIVDYGDPSFKETKNSDYKAIVLVAKRHDGTIDILRAWVRQASISAMVQTFYYHHSICKEFARYYIESNFLQAMFLDEFKRHGNQVGYQLPIRGDARKKPDKYTRIENLSPLFERGHIFFNEEERSNADMQTLILQLLSFPTGHDDAPDALEGGVNFLQNTARVATFERRAGKFNMRSSRD
jgi:predicted phage terminase large subunit-like protein